MQTYFRYSTQVELKKRYNDQRVSKGLLSGNDWYEIQAFRALQPSSRSVHQTQVNTEQEHKYYTYYTYSVQKIKITRSMLNFNLDIYDSTGGPKMLLKVD